MKLWTTSTSSTTSRMASSTTNSFDVDWKFSNALLKKGTRDAYKTWNQQDIAWVDMRLHESHDEGCFGVSNNTIVVFVSERTNKRHRHHLVTPYHTRQTPGLLPSWAPLPALLSRSGCQATTSRTPQVGLPLPSARSSACTGTSCSSTTAPNTWQWHSPRCRPTPVAALLPTRAHTRSLTQAPRTTAMASSSYRNSTAFIWHSNGVRCPPRSLPPLRTSSPSISRSPSSLPSAVSRSSSPRSSSPRIGHPSRSCISASPAHASRNSISVTSLRSTRPQSLTPPCAWR
jgi:hypothetical protein